MATRDIYLKIEPLNGYSPVQPADHYAPPIQYGRDCMRTAGHEDATIPPDEIEARRLSALIYREYLDPQYLIPKPDKLVAPDINEPPFSHRVPGTVVYASPGEFLRIHVKNGDSRPHSFHVHGLRYGIDSDGAWPLGTQSSDGRRSDEICPGQTWTYTYEVTEEMLGAWPFHDHCRNIGDNTNRGLFGGIVVLPQDECERVPRFPFPKGFLERALKAAGRARPLAGVGQEAAVSAADNPGPSAMPAMAAGTEMPGMGAMLARTAMAGPTDQHHLDLTAIPPEVVPYLVTLDELSHAPAPSIPKEEPLHVPLFFHQMSGARDTPLFQSAPLNPGTTFTSAPFTVPGTYNYICGIHGAMMSGQVTIVAGGPATASVAIADFSFTPASVTVGVGGTVSWTNTGPSQHSVLEAGGASLASYCFNGRSFAGNTPTIVAHAGQRIRWYVFDLDLSMGWHNFHTHAQRWRFAEQTVDTRSIGPAESFVVETVAPPVLLLPEDIQRSQPPRRRRRGAKRYELRGDFLFHCHVEMHMMGGLVGLIRSHQTVWLTDKERDELAATVGLPVDPGDNACPAVDPNRCATSAAGQWQELPGLPGITFMHAVLLPYSSRILFWGYGPRADQARLWDQATGLYTTPANQPQALTTDENIWSGSHAHLNDATGTILVHGGFYNSPAPPLTSNTERRSFLFDPTTSSFQTTADMHTGRFYPTDVTLADGKAMTLFGSTHGGTELTAASFEIFDPAAGSWSAPTPLPFNYFYYPWTFLLPGGDLFIAGPQKPARRFDPATIPIVDDPASQYNQVYPQRGVNMDGTAVLLPLRPPLYQLRVMIAGGSSTYWSASEGGALNTAEWIDLSAPSPAWQALPNMNIVRDHLNSVLLPDGTVIVLGGWENPPDGGPVEIFDPEDPTSGFQLGPNMTHSRGYHSAAILLPDGSVVMGGQGGEGDGHATPNERYLPSYFFKPRPAIVSSPATLAYGEAFSIGTAVPNAIAEVVMMRAGAVTHAFNHNQRYVGCAITGTSATAINATAPPDGTVAPPGHYLLFLLDHDRVPSEANWVRLS